MAEKIQPRNGGIYMNKKHLRTYVDDFFDTLEMYEDLARGHNFKTYIHQSVCKFFDFESKETAMDVYLSFFDAYRITMGESQNAFADLLDMMRSYEEKASTLTARQRDHYVHSVNVFLLGLAVFSQNAAYRRAFNTSVMDKKSYPFSYDTRNEEFFYRWGIASLFHDAGYPMEIIHKQTDQYLNFIVDAVGKKEEKVDTYLAFSDFSKFNTLPQLEGFPSFCQGFLQSYPGMTLENVSRPLDLLSAGIAQSLSVAFPSVKEKLDGFIADMQRFHFVDHGFYSAVIVLQWYAYLMQLSGWKSEYFFSPILNCATAILLHNYYGNVLQKEPFSLPPLKANLHPIGWLLILCDELQEWNREAYGWIDKTKPAADRSDITVTDGYIKVVYVSEKASLGSGFEREKENLLYSRLDLDQLFPEGFEVSSVSAGSAAWNMHQTFRETSVIPRPLLPQLEEVAKMIHSDYVQKHGSSKKPVPPELREWDELPEDIKYSNLSQARHISEKLRTVGCGIASADSGFAPLSELESGEIEALSALEHQRWVAERRASGWTLGPKKDIAKKISPYLVSWEDLTEPIRDLDRDAVRNIIPLLARVGLIAYRK